METYEVSFVFTVKAKNEDDAEMKACAIYDDGNSEIRIKKLKNKKHLTNNK